jgi:hypothetical protein
MSTNEDVLLISDWISGIDRRAPTFVVRRIIVWLTERLAGAQLGNHRVWIAIVDLLFSCHRVRISALACDGRVGEKHFSRHASHVKVGPTLRSGSVLSSKSKR